VPQPPVSAGYHIHRNLLSPVEFFHSGASVDQLIVVTKLMFIKKLLIDVIVKLKLIALIQKVQQLH
jgi:hypothetical protein